MRKGRNRIAPTEKILIETDEKIEKLEGETSNYSLAGISWAGIKDMEISGLKVQAYDRIHKIFMEDS